MNSARANLGAPSDATISVAVVRALFAAVEQAGVPRTRLIASAQLGSEPLEGAEARISGLKAHELCALAIELTNDPAFGLHWAESLTTNALIPVSHLIAHSPNLREAFAALAKFYRLLCDRRYHELHELDDAVTVRCSRVSGSPRMQRFSAEMMVTFFFRLIRSFDSHARPRCVSFEYPAPAYRSEYTRLFEGTERFEQPFTGIVFDRALLDRPGPHVDDDLHEALHALAERRLLRMTQRTPYAVRVRELLVRHAAPHRSGMRTIARELGMSTRSLRRRLAAEGKSYNEVVNDALATVAKQLLESKQRTIQETAYELGFADARTFHRAFKRWTGMTPTAFRYASLENAAPVS